MTRCAEVHREYDRLANGKIHTGALPNWMSIRGKVAWYVFQGPYSGLSEAWAKFGKELSSIPPEKFAGPPGDVYACSPMDHEGTEEKLITILWAPLKE